MSFFFGFENSKDRRGLRFGKDAKPETRAYSLKEFETLKTAFSNLFSESLAGVNVTAKTSMGLAAVFSSVRVISEDLASMPMEVIRKNNDTRERDPDYFLYDLIHDNPNKFQTAFTFYDSMVMMVNLWGNAFALIHRNGLGQAIELEIIHPTEMQYYLDKRKLWYRVRNQSELTRAEDIIHIAGPSFDGIAGVSMIQLHRETIGGGIAARDFGNTFFKNGAALDGLLSSEKNLTQPQLDAYSESWNKKHTGGPQKAHNTAILGAGLKYQPIGIPPEDAQFIETMKFSRSQIAGIYRVSAHKINDLDAATFSNIEHLGIEHVNNAIRPWAKRIEQEFERKLVPESDKKTITLKFNLLALMRGDSESRVKYYKDLWSIAALSANEVRRLEDLNGYDGGDQRFIPLNSMPVGQSENYFDAKIKKLES